MNNDYPVLDGIAPSWADVTIKCSLYNGPLIETKDVAAFSRGSTVEVGEQRGTSGGRVMKVTTGSVSHEASITLYRSGLQTLARAFASIAPVRGNQRLISLVRFDIQIQHTPPNDVEIYEFRAKGCRLMGVSMSLAEGTDADQVEIPLKPIEIVDVIDGQEIVLL